jgi:phosphoribosylformylglycinamidine cyclo-ligase
MSQTYQQSGVSLEAGYESVRRIKKHIAKTERLGMMGNIGSFGGMFDLSLLNMKEPILVSGTDGVGTKLKLAFWLDKHDTIGQDVVAMCVNDVLAQGAQPLFFLDYIAVGKNDPAQIEQIVKGVADGCVLANCALIGGETAEMPDMYAEDEYDIAGFTVGVVEKSKLIDGSKVNIGDVLIGIQSSGVHSNGFSLVRKIVMKDHNFDLYQYYDELKGKLGEVLLTPTKIYVKPVLEALQKVDIHAICHITGGGFDENIPRVLKENQGVEIWENSWEKPLIFNFLEKWGKIPHREMFNIFNMGIGMILVVKPEDAAQTLEILKNCGEKVFEIGKVVQHCHAVTPSRVAIII